jgi:D-proline reductase (dithiol) PrdB
LAARHLEANGNATVIMGSAKDIVEHCGVPRFVFSDFPLGNSAGKPHDPTSQRETLSLALQILETATKPRTTVRSAQLWSEDSTWKDEFFSIQHLSAQELARRRAEFDQIKAVAKDIRDQTPESQ